MSLDRAGYSETLAALHAPLIPEGFEVARVTAVNRNNVEIIAAGGSVVAELTGRLRHGREPEELPAVGDWVVSQIMDDGDFALVIDVLPRSSTLARQAAGKRVDVQMIAANVDTAFVVHPCDQRFNPRRIERYLVIARDGGIEPVILLSKADQASDLEALVTAAEALAETIVTSGLDEAGVTTLEKRLVAGKTYVLLGSSGVGKSTLLNRLVGEDVFATQEVRDGDHKGRHTTTRRKLVTLESGPIVIDTPGMRELGMINVDSGLDEAFEDILALAKDCRFRDCAHIEEAGCAVLEAVDDGSLDVGRLQSYLKLERESAHFERSHLELRQRDKALGKMYKSVIQQKKDRR